MGGGAPRSWTFSLKALHPAIEGISGRQRASMRRLAWWQWAVAAPPSHCGTARRRSGTRTAGEGSYREHEIDVP